MSIKEKQNSPTYQDTDFFEYPQSEEETSKLIKNYYKLNVPIEIIGTGSKKKIGKALRCTKSISLSKLSGIIEYLPEELYVRVKTGTPIKQVEEELKKNKQMLAFEPIDFGYLFEGKSNQGTVGGYVSCNISGPRRFKVGSVRDHLLGFRGINGKGEIIKSGGNVVKNVTGYDLSKIVCGSFGTLVALSEVTLKVLPTPEDSKTLILHNFKLEEALDFLNRSISSSNEISGAVFLPTEKEFSGSLTKIQDSFKLNDLKKEGSFTAIRFEGLKGAIEERMKNLIRELKIANLKISILETYQSDIFWNKVKNLEIFSSTSNNVFRIVIPPSFCSQILYQLSSNKFRYYIDWGGSLIWVEAFNLSEEMFDSIRKKVVKCGGYISMIKYSNQLSYVEEVFTINRERFNISQNIKKSFDPKKILNPGKMYTGI